MGKLVAELVRVAEETIARTQWIQTPYLPLQAGAVALSLTIVALVTAMVVNIRHFQFDDYTNFILAALYV